MKKKFKILLLFLFILAISFFVWKKYFMYSTQHAIGSQSVNNLSIRAIDIPSFYNQRDKKWASEKLGNTHESVGKVGCLISSVSMNFSYYGIDLTPKQLNNELRGLEGYTSQGWLIWSKLSPITHNKLHVVFPKLSQERIEHYLKENKPVLAKVLIHHTIPHWVLIVGKEGKEYQILDPLRQEELTNISTYGDYIYSIRVLDGNKPKTPLATKEVLVDKKSTVSTQKQEKLANSSTSTHKKETNIEKFVNAGKQQIGKTLTYNPEYVKLDYPMGDIDISKGVCTDVVVRALRGLNIDLQARIYEHKKSHPLLYKGLYGSNKLNPNIDHRRVKNIQAYLVERGYQVKDDHYKTGDIVVWKVNKKFDHIGICSSKLNAKGEPYIIHNIGSGAKEEDVLRAYKIIDHFRVFEK